MAKRSRRNVPYNPFDISSFTFSKLPNLQCLQKYLGFLNINTYAQLPLSIEHFEMFANLITRQYTKECVSHVNRYITANQFLQQSTGRLSVSVCTNTH